MDRTMNQRGMREHRRRNIRHAGYCGAKPIEHLEDRALFSATLAPMIPPPSPPTGPTVGMLTVSPDSVAVGQTVTITATNVTNPEGTPVSQVTFYQEANGRPGFQGLEDGYFGTDTDGSDGWSVVVDTEFMTQGTVTAAAYATAGNLTGNSRYANFTIGPPAATGSIAGLSFNDANANGVLDAGEAKLANRQVYLDLNSNGSRDASEPQTLTQADGSFQFDNLSARTYRVREVLPSGWRRTTPSAGYALVDVNGGPESGIKFGSTQKALLSGTVYNDLDGNGAKSAAEPGLSGWTVFLDSNGNGAADTGEPRQTTTAGGAYAFKTLAPGPYKVRAILPAGWRRTEPTGGTWSVTLAAGGSASGKNLGVTQKALISGNVFNDANGNAKRDSGEAGKQSWRVYIDASGAGSGTWQSNERSVLTDSAGNWSFKNLSAGTYRIRLVLLTGYKQTVPVSSYTITVAAAQSVTGKLFGVKKLG